METGSLDDDFTKNFSLYQIYLHTWTDILWVSTWFIYNQENDDGEWTWFARYLLITWVVDEGGNVVDTDKLLKIESHVLYRKWYLTGEKVMETFMWNYEFSQ